MGQGHLFWQGWWKPDSIRQRESAVYRLSGGFASIDSIHVHREMTGLFDRFMSGFMGVDPGFLAGLSENVENPSENVVYGFSRENVINYIYLFIPDFKDIFYSDKICRKYSGFCLWAIKFRLEWFLCGNE